MTDDYRDDIEEAEKRAKDPETAPRAPEDWPKIGGATPKEPEEDA